MQDSESVKISPALGVGLVDDLAQTLTVVLHYLHVVILKLTVQ